MNGSLTVSGVELTGQGGEGHDSQGVSSATRITVQEGGKLTGIGVDVSGQSIGVYSGSLTVSGGELVAQGGKGMRSYGVQNNGGAITITVTSGRITAAGNTSAVSPGWNANITVAAEENTAYAWRTQASDPYTYSDDKAYQYDDNKNATYLEVASVHALTVKQAEGGTVSVSPDGSARPSPL